MKKIQILAIIFAVFTLFSCGKGSDEGEILISNYGPKELTIGKIFNPQPNGIGALWIQGENFSKNSVIVFNGADLETQTNNDGKSATAFLPLNLYDKEGQVELYIKDKMTKIESKRQIVIVKK